MSAHAVLAAISALEADYETWVWTGRTLGEISIAKAEAVFGIAMPPDYKDFLLEHGCAAVLSEDPSVGLEIYGLARVCPTPMDVRERFTRLVVAGVAGLVPVAGAPRGEPILAFDAAGAFYFLDGETRTPVDGGFTELAVGLLGALAGRRAGEDSPPQN